MAKEAGYLHLWGFSGVLRDGVDSGALKLARNEIHVMETIAPGEIVVNYSRINADPFDPFPLVNAQLTDMEQVMQLHDWFCKTIPAFSDSRILQSGYVGIRESGRVKGRSVLNREHILSNQTGSPVSVWEQDEKTLLLLSQGFDSAFFWISQDICTKDYCFFDYYVLPDSLCVSTAKEAWEAIANGHYDVAFGVSDCGPIALYVTLNPETVDLGELQTIIESVCAAHGIWFQNPPGM